MKFRQSALPYLLLTASIIIGIPILAHFAEVQKNAPITYEIKVRMPIVADCYNVRP